MSGHHNLDDVLDAMQPPIEEEGVDWMRVAEAWANVMDGRRIGSGLHAARIGRATTTLDDWHAIATEYVRLLVTQ